MTLEKKLREARNRHQAAAERLRQAKLAQSEIQGFGRAQDRNETLLERITGRKASAVIDQGSGARAQEELAAAMEELAQAQEEMERIEIQAAESHVEQLVVDLAPLSGQLRESSRKTLEALLVLQDRAKEFFIMQNQFRDKLMEFHTAGQTAGLGMPNLDRDSHLNMLDAFLPEPSRLGFSPCDLLFVLNRFGMNPSNDEAWLLSRLRDIKTTIPRKDR